ncbi:hypothetical protein OWV82_015109 [Melia azedarach]|uniref:Uncharacterized protein n=1 Tax=Melia azedarach TaxID=155640 RepID=A0ACC1XPZ1_MELAZ|nr:hypothetical protein OWV82_015109 [Melia azedarach]
MAILPINNPELFPHSFLMAHMAFYATLSGVYLIFSSFLDSRRAIVATIGFTGCFHWAVSGGEPAALANLIHEAIFLISFSVIYERISPRAWLVSFLGSNLFFVVLICYIPLMLNYFFSGDIRFQDLFAAHLYLIGQVGFMRIVWVYSSVIGGNGNVSAGWVAFVGFVLVMEGWFFLREFETMELEKIHRGVMDDAKAYLDNF